VFVDKNWPTKNKDMHIAHSIMEQYATQQNSGALGLFELVVNQTEKRMNFRLANWVLAIANRFNSLYGVNQGEEITRLVISHCMIQGQTLH